MMIRRQLLAIATLTFIYIPAGVIAEQEENRPGIDPAGMATRIQRSAETFPVPPPPFSEGIFPCSSCHAYIPANLQRRDLTNHTDIVLNHAEGQRWCLDCHNPDDRDTLRLVSGDVISFDESYLLCGQCHGDKYRDWRLGLHGKRTGYWNGEKQYLLCAHCHNPHDPSFKPINPLPPPVRPDAIRK